MRHQPNIIVTGTPGVGKTSHCERLVEETGLKHISVNEVAKRKECHDGWDEERRCWIVDEDQLLDAIEDDVRQGGCIIDWHACDMFPARWIDLVVVLRTDSATLYDRLVGRKYPEAKLQENLDSEIMDVLIQEAREAFDEDIVVELQSVSTENMESNVGRIIAWIKQWKKDHDGRSTNDEDEGVDEANGGEDKEEDDDEDADENDDDDDENDDDEGEEDEDNYEDEKGQGKETSVVAKREGALKTVE